MSDSVEVLGEKIREHDRRIDQMEDMARETSKGASDLLVVTERHSEQIGTLTRVIYSGMFISATAIVSVFLKFR